MREQWAALGVDPDLAEEANAEIDAPPLDAIEDDEDDGADIELPPEAWDAWQCFVGTWSQWRVLVGFSVVIYDGIDQACLLAAMDMLGVRKQDRQRVYWQVQVMEDEARPLRNQKQQ